MIISWWQSPKPTLILINTAIVTIINCINHCLLLFDTILVARTAIMTPVEQKLDEILTYIATGIKLWSLSSIQDEFCTHVIDTNIVYVCAIADINKGLEVLHFNMNIMMSKVEARNSKKETIETKYDHACSVYSSFIIWCCVLKEDTITDKRLVQG